MFSRRIGILARLLRKNQGEKFVFNMKSFVVPAALVFASILGTSTAKAENPACYTLASLQGSWSVVATYGANVAIALGQRYLDGGGNLTGVFTLNAPVVGDPNGARVISTGTQAGTTNVNCDGSGTFNRVLTSSLGIVTNQVDNFIITAGVVKNGQLIATSIADAVQTPSALVPGGIFVTRVHTRLPDRPGPTQP
jgi:hypothetical protein